MLRNLIGAAIALCATAGFAMAGVDVGVRASLPAPPPPPGVNVHVGVSAPPTAPAPVVVKKGDNGKHLGHYKKKRNGKKH